MTLLLFFPTRPLYEAPFAIYPPGFLTLILWRPPWGPLCVRRAHGVPGVWAGPAFGSGSTLLPVLRLVGDTGQVDGTRDRQFK